MEFETEFVEFEKNKRLVGRQIKGDFKRSESTTVFEATEKGTKVTSINDYELPYSVLGKLLDRLKARKDLERFYKVANEKAKEILEAG